MAVATDGRVLAVVQSRLQVANEKVAVEVVNPNDPDDKRIVEQWEPVFANPGDVIDVAHWNAIGAYVERGQITLLSPAEVRAHIEAEKAAATTPPKSEVVPPAGQDEPKTQGRKPQPAKTKE